MALLFLFENQVGAQTVNDLPKGCAAYIGQRSLISAAGPGLKEKAGDILLELKDPENEDWRVVLLLHKAADGKLEQIGENSALVMAPDMLGGGSCTAALNGPCLTIDWRLGSSSAYSTGSMVFVKAKDDKYYFNTYCLRTQNYGIENYYARDYVNAVQTGQLPFDNTSEAKILQLAARGKVLEKPVDFARGNQVFKAFIPKGFRLATFAVGDINLDGQKIDALLFLYNQSESRIRLLLSQTGMGYRLGGDNSRILATGEGFNSNNVHLVIKEGYFTVEQRSAGVKRNHDDSRSDDHQNEKNNPLAGFVQNEITFKWDTASGEPLLHRFQAGLFTAPDKAPASMAFDLNKNNFGKVAFSHMNTAAFTAARKFKGKNVFYYDPAISKMTGTIVRVKEDEQSYFILRPDAPVNIIADPAEPDPEIRDHDLKDVAEIQLYFMSTHAAMISGYCIASMLNKRVTLWGQLFTGRTADQKAAVLMEVNQLKPVN